VYFVGDKIKVVTILITYYAMKPYREVEVWLRAFLSLTYADEFSASGPGSFITVETAPGTNRKGG
jgi:hypothetical protein